jgi:hypothetical protein
VTDLDQRPTHGATHRPGHVDERASALVLAPALVLVLIVLGGMAVDLALVRSARRALDDSVAAAADDAAGMLDERRLLVDGTVLIDPAAARRVAEARLGTTRLTGRVAAVRVDVRGTEVRVEADLSVPPVFLRALGGGERRVRSAAVARATT